MFLFTILKVLGLILLILAGLIILIIGLVFFVPLRYKIDGSFIDEIPDGSASVSWMFSLVKGYVLYSKADGISAGVSILGKKIYDPFDERNVDDKPSSAFDKDMTIAGTDTDKNATKQKSDSEIIVQDTSKQTDELLTDSKPASKGKSKSPGIRKRLKVFIDKSILSIKRLCSDIYDFFRALYMAVKDKTDRLKKLYELINKDKYKEALGFLKKEVFSVLKDIKPKKGSGYLEFGSGDPYNTGVVMEAAAVLYPLYCDWFNISPDFTQSRLEGKLSIKGRFGIFFIAFPLLRIYLNKDLKALYNKSRKILGIADD